MSQPLKADCHVWFLYSCYDSSNLRPLLNRVSMKKNLFLSTMLISMQVLVSAQSTPPSSLIEIEEIGFSPAQTMPSFQGGDLNSFRAWIMRHVVVPQSAETTTSPQTVVMTFVVEKDGTMSGIQFLTPIDDALAEEIIRVMKSAPKWEPGRGRGGAICVRYNVPMKF